MALDPSSGEHDSAGLTVWRACLRWAQRVGSMTVLAPTSGEHDSVSPNEWRA